jgi:hypothetical protein
MWTRSTRERGLSRVRHEIECRWLRSPMDCEIWSLVGNFVHASLFAYLSFLTVSFLVFLLRDTLRELRELCTLSKSELDLGRMALVGQQVIYCAE